MQPPISLNSTIIRVDDLVSCDLDGETALLSVKNGKYYALDHIGSRIWVLLAQARTVSDLCARLLQEYEVEPPQCQKDVLDFLHALAQDDLIKVADESPA